MSKLWMGLLIVSCILTLIIIIGIGYRYNTYYRNDGYQLMGAQAKRVMDTQLKQGNAVIAFLFSVSLIMVAVSSYFYDKSSKNTVQMKTIITGMCAAQNGDAPDTFTPGKSYYISYCSLDAKNKASAGRWYCPTTLGDEQKKRAAVYVPSNNSHPEFMRLTLCDYGCADFGNQPPDSTKYVTALMTSNQPFGYGEYAVWIKNSATDGIISCFYLSKKYATDSKNMTISDGQIELDWEVTPHPDDRYNKLICDSNIYAFNKDPCYTNDTCQIIPCSPDITRCDGIPCCQQPHDFILDFTGGFPTSSSNYTGAIQYIIGVYPNKIEFKLVDASYKLLYLRVLDKDARTDIATIYAPDGTTPPQKIFTNTNFDKIRDLYRDETTLYPFINVWAPNSNWLTQSFQKGNLLYNPNNIDALEDSQQCNNCQSSGDPFNEGDPGYKTSKGPSAFVFGAFTFTPAPENKIFKPSDWLAFESTT